MLDFCKLESLKRAIFLWKNNDFYKIAILGKNTKNHRKTIPKSSRNPSKINQKSKKIDSKTQDGLRWPEMRPRSAQEAPKSEKRCYRTLPRRSSETHSAELGRGGSGGEAEVRSDRLSARRGPGALFTLRASRQGQLEAEGCETHCPAFWVKRKAGFLC